MSQQSKILELLRASKTVSCRAFNAEFLFHKLASRCSDLRKEGYDIRYNPSQTNSPMDASYTLISEPTQATPQSVSKFILNGEQFEMFDDVING